MFYTFIGTQPLAANSAGSRTDGNILDRMAVLVMFALSLVILWSKRRAAITCILTNWALLSVVSCCVMSIIWSEYPDLTLRRGIWLIFIVSITLAIAVGTTDLRRLHTLLFASLTGIVLLNLVVTALVPSIAISELGVRGIYTQKNVAGIVAMITIIFGASWIVGAQTWKSRLAGIVALLPVLVFLVVTRSKTSISLTALGLCLIIYFSLAERFGARFILATVFLGFLLLSSALLLLAAVDFDLDLVVQGAIGDSSFTGRDELWAFAHREATKHYWLGHGYGAFWDVGLANDPLKRVEIGSWLSYVETGVINQAHNGYLDLWLQIGWPMTIVAMLAVMARTVAGGIQAVLGRGSRQTRAALGGFVVLLLLYLLHNLTEATLFARGASLCIISFLALFVLSRARYFSDAPSANLIR